jgi:hypothetical protein
MSRILRLISFFFLIIPLCCFTLCMKSCTEIEGEMSHLTPEQTYKCSFHDKPLVLVGWRGKMAIRRYKMKDPTRGTVIEGIRHYARKCSAIPVSITPEVKSQLDLLKAVRDSQAWWAFFSLLLTGVCVYGRPHRLLQVWFDDRERELERNRERQLREEKENSRKEIEMEREMKLEMERERSRKAHQDRLERKSRRREMMKGGCLK